MVGASLKVIFDVVTAYPFEHNFQVGKGDKEKLSEIVTAAESFEPTYSFSPDSRVPQRVVLRYTKTTWHLPQTRSMGTGFQIMSVRALYIRRSMASFAARHLPSTAVNSFIAFGFCWIYEYSGASNSFS
ncbi:MAG: hypothetical protein IJV74_07585, partial [Clostridia bacterium]|nr:hypothetical protein [Clostridia bacterium]